MFSTKNTIRLHHTDSAGVIYFAHLLTLAHECYEAFLDTVLPLNTLLEQGNLLIPITHAQADYLGPIRVGDVLNIELSLTSHTEHSFTLTYTFKNGQVTMATALTRHVIILANDRQKAAIPDALKQGLLAL